MRGRHRRVHTKTARSTHPVLWPNIAACEGTLPRLVPQLWREIIRWCDATAAARLLRASKEVHLNVPGWDLYDCIIRNHPNDLQRYRIRAQVAKKIFFHVALWRRGIISEAECCVGRTHFVMWLSMKDASRLVDLLQDRTCISWLLRDCIKYSNMDLAAYILRQKEDSLYRWSQDTALLHDAARVSIEVFQKMQAETKINDYFHNGLHVMAVAARSSRWDIVRHLIEKGEDCRVVLPYIDSVARLSAFREMGADVDAHKDDILVSACGKANIELVTLMLDAGADIHHQDEACLRTAVLQRNETMVRLLVDRGADVHVDHDGLFRRSPKCIQAIFYNVQTSNHFPHSAVEWNTFIH